MKLNIATIVACVVVLMTTVCATTNDISVDVKYNTSAPSSVFTSISDVIMAQDDNITKVTWTTKPTSFTEDCEGEATVTYADGSSDSITVQCSVVLPEIALKTTTITRIYTTDDENKSASTLLAYVNSDLTYTIENDVEYSSALGTGATISIPKFTWSDCSDDYDASGDSYTFTQSYLGQTLTRKVTVKETTVKAPDIDYDLETVKLDNEDKLEWSYDKKDWSTCSVEADIQSGWFGEKVYFRYAETSYTDASDSVSITFPTQVSTITTKPAVVATSNSITVTNVDVYDNPEFSINDGESWKSASSGRCVFVSLDASTTYKVMVREPATSIEFASNTLTTSIKTSAEVETEIVNEVVLDDDTYTYYIAASATVTPNLYNGEMSGALESIHFTDELYYLAKEFDTEGYNVLVDLDISHVPEENDPIEVLTATLEVHRSALSKLLGYATVNAVVHTPFMDVTLSNSTLKTLASQSSTWVEFTTSKFDDSSELSSAVSTYWKQGYDVYYTNFSCGSKTASGVTLSIPFILDEDEIMGTLVIYHVTSGDKFTLISDYDYSGGAVTFDASDGEGYYIIGNETIDTSTLGFTDISNHWGLDYIAYAVQEGWFQGVSSTSFAPDMDVTTAMVVTLLYRMDGAPVVNTAETTSWYSTALSWAVETGLVSTSETFSPDVGMTREEVAVMLADYLEYLGLSRITTSANYSDQSSITSSARADTNWLYNLGIMMGDDEGNFNPDNVVTRAEMSAILYRLKMETLT